MTQRAPVLQYVLIGMFSYGIFFPFIPSPAPQVQFGTYDSTPITHFKALLDWDEFFALYKPLYKTPFYALFVYLPLVFWVGKGLLSFLTFWTAKDPMRIEEALKEELANELRKNRTAR